MTIRRASKNDIDQLTELFFEFYWKFNMNGILTGPSKELLQVDNPQKFSEDIIKSYFDDNEVIFVCETDNKIVGYICGTIKKHKHYLHSPEANIIDWFVTETHRGQGIGKALYDKFVSEVKVMGCKYLSLEAFWTNHQTISTYERLGFFKDEVVLKKII